MPLARQLIHQGLTSSVPLVRRTYSFSLKSLAVDRNHTVLQRIEPGSRTTLTGEQPDPSELLHPEDVTSWHRVFVSFKILASIKGNALRFLNGELLILLGIYKHILSEQWHSTAPYNYRFKINFQKTVQNAIWIFNAPSSIYQ